MLGLINPGESVIPRIQCLGVNQSYRNEQPQDGGPLKPTMPVLLDCNFLSYAATVILNSSVGARQACPGQMVTYTCTVNQGAILDWIVTLL